MSPALPKNNGQGLILWRKATVSKCLRRLENENKISLRQHLTACPSSYEENTERFVGILEMIISLVRRSDMLQPQSKIIVYRMDKIR